MDSGAALQQVKERYLGQTIRIRLTDGRVVEGTLQALDYLMNFVVGGAIELFGLPTVDASEDTCIRWKDVGTAVVPGKHVEAVVLRVNNNNKEGGKYDN